MTVPWAKIAAIGVILSILTVSPFILKGLSHLPTLATAGIEDVTLGAYLFAGGVKALVPVTIGGALLLIFFKVAADKA